MVRIFPGEGLLAEAAAERVVEIAVGSIAARGRFHLGLSGGRTPSRLYRVLSGGIRDRVDWSRVWIYFADERAVPPDHSDSNFRMARETLIDPAGVPPRNVHRMKGEYPDLEVAVAEYEAYLVDHLDALILGVGEDGHIASIFPGSPLTVERTRRVAAVLDSPKPPARRITITPRAIREAHAVLVLASGESKVQAVARALEGEVDIRRHPARMLREYEWLIEQSAARGLAAAGDRPPSP